MILKNNTILVTGGSSGIGLQLARTLSKDNQVIICGRSEEKLSKAKQSLPAIDTYQCDVSQRSECEKMVEWIRTHYPNCNVLINNAAIVHRTHFYDDEQMLRKVDAEIQTNLMSPIMLSKLFMQLMEQNHNPTLINITTGLVYAPKAAYPVYNATKAALHSFTQVLRLQMKDKPIAIIEVLMPAVDTPWHEGNPPNFAITPEVAVSEMIGQLKKGKEEIKVGKVKLLYRLSRIAPAFAVKKINET